MTFDVSLIQEWISTAFTFIGALVTFASVVVKLTPTLSDDDFLAKVIECLDSLSVFNPNGTKTIKDE